MGWLGHREPLEDGNRLRRAAKDRRCRIVNFMVLYWALGAASWLFVLPSAGGMN